MTVGEATEVFQSYLEGVRAHPDDEVLADELERSRAVLEVAWLEHAMAAR